MTKEVIEKYVRRVKYTENDFHFMRYVRCPDVGVDCMGYGDVMLKIQAVPRINI